MHAEIRQLYNAHFTQERYERFLRDLNTTFEYPISFRVAETPVFLPRKFKYRLRDAAYSIIDFLTQADFKQITENAVPPRYNVPNENDHPLFFVVDFAVCRDSYGELIPQLIEFQGCPSLYAYQDWVANKYREHFPTIPSDWHHLARDLDRHEYYTLLRQAIFADHDPENVVLLELNPYQQNTLIDFLCHRDRLGTEIVNITDVEKEGRQLFYRKNGRRVPIHRIYNRSIFDELIQHPELDPAFKLTDDVDVEWAGHPNWFFRISKYTLPFMESMYVPETRFLHQIDRLPDDLENYVLKPLYSFAGSGVIFDVSKEDIARIPGAQRNEYILQKKVNYEPIIQAPDGLVKLEIRLLFIWPEKESRPRFVTNLSRLSRGKLIGVKYNKDKTWVGGSVCFMEPG